MAQMTKAQYDQIVWAKGPQWANDWRVKNGVQVEGMQPVDYQQPDEEMYDENGELYPVENQGGALPSAPALPSVATQSAPSSGNVPGLPSLQDIYGMQAQLGKDLSTFWSDVRKDRKAQYDLATAELEKRRFGPSRAEQLFQLAAAIGTPTIDRSFGSIMANVIPAFASIEKAKRTAEEERSAAAQALRNKYLGEDQQLGFNILEQRQKNLSAVTPLAVAQARQPSVGTSYDAMRGIFVNRNNPRPTENTYTVGNGRTLVQWQDGLWREQLPNGTYKVFERAGNSFKELRIEGAR